MRRRTLDRQVDTSKDLMRANALDAAASKDVHDATEIEREAQSKRAAESQNLAATTQKVCTDLSRR